MSRLARLEAMEASIKVEKKLAKIEDEFVAKKMVGLVRIAEEKAEAFKAARSADEYESLVAQIVPANSSEDKRILREARQFWRENHRKPKENGASVGAIGTKVGVEAV